MKKTKLTTVVGLLAGATLVYFNVRHALNDYGIRDNEKLHPAVMAQAGTTNGNGSGGGSGSSGGDSSDKGDVTGGVENCPLNKYIRNAQEAWDYKKTESNADGGIKIVTEGGRTIVDFNASAKVGSTYRVPDCVRSEGNCCDKEHLKTKPKALF